MKLIDEHYRGRDVRNESTTPYEHYFEYCTEEEDFFLRRRIFWKETEEPEQWLKIRIGGKREVSLPESMFLMVGDVYSPQCDWIRVSELLGRKNMSTFVYPITMTDGDWLVEEIEVVGEAGFSITRTPDSKSLLPIALGSDKMIIVSEVDAFTKTKNIDMTSI